MSATVTKVRVFVASPGDVESERTSLSKIIDELNTTIAPDKGYVLELVRWETHSTPSMGRPQAIINQQVGRYDIFLGVMWKRFGSPTGLAESGTEEEFNLAYKMWTESGSPWIAFYFCQKPFLPQAEDELEQYSKVLRFRRELQGKGLVWEYSTPSEFADTVRPHLVRILLDIARDDGENGSPELPPTTPSGPIIFLVSGADILSSNKVQAFLEELGYSVVSLSREASQGKTIVEKFSHLAHRASKAVVVVSGDEMSPSKKRIPRQNVVFELGYLNALLGRDRVIILSEHGVEYPSDLMGSILLQYSERKVETTFEHLRRELHSVPSERHQIIRRTFLYDVFLSYSSNDEQYARRIKQALEDSGLSCFMASKDIHAGQSFVDEVRNAVLNSREMCLLLSQDSIGSPWLQAEWAAAWVLEKRIVPILLNVETEDLPSRLAQRQNVDFNQLDRYIYEVKGRRAILNIQ